MTHIQSVNGSKIHLNLLGIPELYVNGEQRQFATQHQLALLAYLVIESGKTHRRDVLASLFWSETTDARAKQNLRQALYSLRQTLGDVDNTYLNASRSTVKFNSNGDIWVDIAEFNGESTPRQESLSADTLIQRIALYKSDFLAGIYIDDAVGFDEWHQRQSTKYFQMLIQYYDSLLDHLLHDNKFDDAYHYAESLLSHDITREQTYQHLMRIAAHRHDRDLLTDIYDRCMNTLQTELGVEPSFETRSLLRELLVKLGSTRNNLPTLAPAFVGRTATLEHLQQQLDKPTCRLLSLVGPGGNGKTRLAVEIAHKRLPRYSDGVYFLSVETLKTPDDLLISLINIVGLQHSGTKSPREVVLNYLREKQILLIVDNFEHVYGAVGLLETLIQSAPKLQIIVTTRIRLQIPSEHAVAVNGLSLLSDPHKLSEAEMLFIQSAQQTDQNFDPTEDDLRIIRQICSRLDGSPLAILLAAAWIHALSIADIAKELEANLDFLSVDHSDVPLRQRSLRVVFEYSWRLLPASEKMMLSRLSLLKGNFTRKAALYIGDEVLTSLLNLAKRCLIQFDRIQARYDIHPLIRYFAAEKLTETDALTVTQHAIVGFYSAQVMTIPNLPLAEHEDATLNLALDFINIRQAWLIALEMNLQQTIGEMSLGFVLLCESSGRYLDGQNLVDAALRSIDPTDILWFQLAGFLGELHVTTSDFEVARVCLDVFQNYLEKTNNDPYMLAHAYVWQGILEMNSGNYESAWQYHTQAHAVYQEHALEDQRLLVQNMLEMGRTAQFQNRYDDANTFFDYGLKISLAVNYRKGAQSSLNNLGALSLRQANYAMAEVYFKDSLYFGRTALTLCNLGIVAFLKHDYVGGIQALAEGCQLFRESGQQQPLAQNLYNLSEGYYRLGQFEDAMRFAEESLSVRRQLNDPRGLAMGLFGVGKIHMMMNNYTQADLLFNEALLLLQGEQDAMVSGFIHLGSAMNAFLQDDLESMSEHLQVCEIQFTRIKRNSALTDVILLRILASLKRGAFMNATEKLLNLLTELDINQPVSTDILTVCVLVLHHAGKIDCALDVLAFLQEKPSADPFYREKLLPNVLFQTPNDRSQVATSTIPDLKQLQECLRTILP